MLESVIDEAPTELMRAIEENLHEHVSFVQRRVDGMTVDDRDELLIVDSGLPSDTFNKILCARLDEASADAAIERALSYFREVDRPFTWWVGPCSRPLDLEVRLERFGLHPSESELGMTIELDKLPDSVALPAGVSIRRVASRAELDAFGGVLAGLSEQPDEQVVAFLERSYEVVSTPDCPMRFYVAAVDGVAAAVSELFVGGGIAGIHMVATSTAYRRRGLGMALTWRALEDGRRLGLKTGALQASQQGVSVYERLGFRPCGSFIEYAPGSKLR